jgi:hypothetical protein
MWTENVAWFSNEEGARGRIESGQFADLVVPDRDYFSCPDNEISDISSELTMVGGKIVYAAGTFAALDQSAPPPAMPDWSPVRTYGGYGAWGAAGQGARFAAPPAARVNSGGCHVHGPGHTPAEAACPPTSDPRAFWGVLGCACWAV